jgi:hypothetical protein
LPPRMHNSLCWTEARTALPGNLRPRLKKRVGYFDNQAARSIRTFRLTILFQSGPREGVFTLGAIPREASMLHQKN